MDARKRVIWRRQTRRESHFDSAFSERYPGPFKRILHCRGGLCRYSTPLPLEIHHR
jgi:hypothetical protein